jgi:hypothetical protein
MRTDKQFYLSERRCRRAGVHRSGDQAHRGDEAGAAEVFRTAAEGGPDREARRALSAKSRAARSTTMAGTPDGTRPGIYYAHLSDMNAMPTYMLEDIAYHEGLPGHHMQISIQQELEAETGPNKLPKFRTQYGYTAYSEGWGLYCGSPVEGDGIPAGPLQRLRPALGRDLARDPARSRHGHPLQGLDRRAGGEIFHRELVHPGRRRSRPKCAATSPRRGRRRPTRSA